MSVESKGCMAFEEVDEKQIIVTICENVLIILERINVKKL